jgi:hypothetical protein
MQRSLAPKWACLRRSSSRPSRKSRSISCAGPARPASHSSEHLAIAGCRHRACRSVKNTCLTSPARGEACPTMRSRRRRERGRCRAAARCPRRPPSRSRPLLRLRGSAGRTWCRAGYLNGGARSSCQSPQHLRIPARTPRAPPGSATCPAPSTCARDRDDHPRN